MHSQKPKSAWPARVTLVTVWVFAWALVVVTCARPV